MLPVAKGVAGAVEDIPGTLEFSGVACPSASSCVAVGQQLGGGVIVPIADGRPGRVSSLPDAFSGVACGSRSFCVAVGWSGEGTVVPITNGIAGAARDAPGARLSGVACANASFCVAVGQSTVFADQGTVVPITNGTAGRPRATPRTVGLSAVSCPAPSSCVAVGDVDVVVLSTSTSRPTRTRLGSSHNPVAPGAEIALVAKVASPFGVPKGHVTFTVDRSTVSTCRGVPLNLQQPDLAVCRLTLNKGIYRVVARYHGGDGFAPSISRVLRERVR